MSRGAALQAYLVDKVGKGVCNPKVADVIGRLAEASATLSRAIAHGKIPRVTGGWSPDSSADGDVKKPIDRYAHTLFHDTLQGSAVAVLASEEADSLATTNPDGELCVGLDPIDGSGNIDLNVSVGTIFSIARWPSEGHTPRVSAGASLWPAGTEQAAAGFVLYGPQTTLMLTVGDSVDLFTLDPDSRTFTLSQAALRLPAVAADDYAVNASNYRHWDEPIRSHVDELVAGAQGPYGRDFNMRWHGALVAEAHRIINRGGIYLYPGDSRDGNRDGRLRLIYEAYPIAFLIECAGGAATNGGRRILNIEAESLHQRVPLVFGSKSMVDRLMASHHRPGLWPPSFPPLFATRGLFRS